jgi:hypothetical protein
MYWATTTFSVTATTPELTTAIKEWKQHIDEMHPLIKEVRCYRFDGGTSYIWQEGFENFNDYQALLEQEDDVCESVMAAVFKHMVPGTRTGKIWGQVI